MGAEKPGLAVKNKVQTATGSMRDQKARAREHKEKAQESKAKSLKQSA